LENLLSWLWLYCRFLEDFVNDGIDILNPFQISVTGMNPDFLKRNYKDKLEKKEQNLYDEKKNSYVGKCNRNQKMEFK